jgi:glutamate synthase domain-containing protein 2
MLWLVLLAVVLVGVAAWVIYDVLQTEHAVVRTFPVIGHLRYWLEDVGPELRQYIVTDNDEERPFSRDQRRWLYASAKGQNNAFGFGSDNEMETAEHYVLLKHAAFPYRPPGAGLLTVSSHAADAPGADVVPAAKVLGGPRGRPHAFRPASAVNISGMSFGSLSGRAVEAMNRGAHAAGCLHNTGEGGLSPHHQHGGELIFQVGTGYFGCRDEQGRFSLPRLQALVDEHPVRAIEVKLSQGAKPGLGGLLPAAKVTPEIARIRGVPAGVDCVSPASHAEFSDADSLLDFVERLAEATGLPVGIKSAVGEDGLWRDLARLMESGERGVDFITVDGGEGGTGAGPLVFTDHVALPFKIGFPRVYRAFAERGIAERVGFIGSGRLGLPENALVAFALGCDMVNVGREAMLAAGCIQAQRCHTGACPTGVATQSRWRARGLDPASKSLRVASYVRSLRRELQALAFAAGVPHPALITADQLEVTDGRLGATAARELFGYEPAGGLPSLADRGALAVPLAASSAPSP